MYHNAATPCGTHSVAGVGRERCRAAHYTIPQEVAIRYSTWGTREGVGSRLNRFSSAGKFIVAQKTGIGLRIGTKPPTLLDTDMLLRMLRS